MMRPVKTRVLLSFGLLWGCSEVRDTDTLTRFAMVDAPSGVTVFYDRDVQRLFDRSCTGGCHEPGGTGVAQSRLDLTSAESFAELMDATRSKNGPHVVANDPDNSLLMWKVAGADAVGRNVFGDRMPFRRPPLDPSEIAMLRRWIEEGAIFSIAPPAPPAIVAIAVRDSETVEVTFDKSLESSSSVDVGNYEIEGDDGSAVSVVAAVLESPSLVVLTTATILAPGTVYTLIVTGVRDLEGLVISAPENGVFRYTPVVSYASQIQPVFDQACASVGCHAANDRFPPGAGLVLDAAVSRSHLVGINSDQQPGFVRVQPGDPDASYLINKLTGVGISGDRMPAGGPFLSPAEIQVFRLWIEQDASDN